MYKEDCIFCKIVQGQIPSAMVFEDDEIFAFKDINPKAPTHVLVIPKYHYDTLNELEDEILMGKLISAVKKITKQLGITDYRTVLNTGKGSGQEVFHVHFHILAGKKLDF